MSYETEVDWTTESGLRAVAIMLDSPHHRCGYVGIPKDHPLYGVGYSDKSPALESCVESVENGPVGDRGVMSIFLMAGRGVEPSPADIFDVHGSLTYAGGENYPVESDLWWFGFDCGHCDDSLATCTLDYVRDHCEGLAQQLSTVHTRQSEDHDEHK